MLRNAAVAVVVSPGERGDEILLLRRATVVGDPWSGHIALPGGRAEPTDTTLEATARRETLEETGIDLRDSRCTAELAPVTPQSAGAPAITIAPFVFRYDGPRAITMSGEIVEAWWIRASELSRPDAWTDSDVTLGDGSHIAVRGFCCHGFVLWGLTARVLNQFLTRT